MTNENTTKDGLLTVQIVHGDNIMYEGQAISISSRNERGRFDILSYHTNYISLIKDFILVKEPSGKENQIVIKSGIMRVYENNVQVFLGFDS